MRRFFYIPIVLIFVMLGCAGEVKENPDGLYGASVNPRAVTELNQIYANKSNYLNHEIVIQGTITSIKEQVGITSFEISSGNETMKCSLEDFKLPKSLEGKEVMVMGMLKEIQVASKKGRDVGGEYTMAADPLSGSGYTEELRLNVKGIQVVKK